jgi:hypothetical protein
MAVLLRAGDLAAGLAALLAAYHAERRNLTYSIAFCYDGHPADGRPRARPTAPSSSSTIRSEAST